MSSSCSKYVHLIDKYNLSRDFLVRAWRVSSFGPWHISKAVYDRVLRKVTPGSYLIFDVSEIDTAAIYVVGRDFRAVAVIQPC